MSKTAFFGIDNNTSKLIFIAVGEQGNVQQANELTNIREQHGELSGNPVIINGPILEISDLYRLKAEIDAALSNLPSELNS